MIITSGEFAGIPLLAPKGMDLRPTLGKIRQAIFNMVRPYLTEQTVCFDFFAGTGALGLEALSNGILKTYFIENEYTTYIQKNTDKLKILPTSFEIIKADYIGAAALLKKRALKCDLFFSDPPYNKGFTKNLLKISELRDIFNKDCIVVLEIFREEVEETIDLLGAFEILKEKRYGETAVIIARVKNTQV